MPGTIDVVSAIMTVEAASGLAHKKLVRAAKIRSMLDAPEPVGLRRRYLIAKQRWIDRVAFHGSRLLTALERRSSRRSVECPLCGWTGLRFRPKAGPGYLIRNHICPECDGVSRHRILAAMWRTRKPPEGLCVSVAPEACLDDLIHERGSVITTDLFMDGVDVRADVERLPMRDGTIPLVVCSDVLEHVVSDRQALREIRRVLRPDGIAVVHVPIVATETVEYNRAIAVDYGHRRAYGPDLVGIVEEAGFDLSLFRSADVPDAMSRRWGLRPDAVLLLTPRQAG